MQQRFNFEAVAHQLINPFKITMWDYILVHKIANSTAFWWVQQCWKVFSPHSSFHRFPGAQIFIYKRLLISSRKKALRWSDSRNSQHGPCASDTQLDSLKAVVSTSKTSKAMRIKRSIYMVVLASAVKGSFDVKRAGCNWTKTRTLQLCVYMLFRTTGLGVLCCWLQASGASFTSTLILLVVVEL